MYQFLPKNQKKKKQVKQTQMSVSKVEMTRHDDEWDLAIFLESKVIKGKGACERECDDVQAKFTQKFIRECLVIWLGQLPRGHAYPIVWNGQINNLKKKFDDYQKWLESDQKPNCKNYIKLKKKKKGQSHSKS